MSKCQKLKIGSFLHERIGRYKPQDPQIITLKRLEKINFSGEMSLSDKTSKTDMIIVKKGDLVISGINVSKGAMAIYRGDEDITATIHYSAYTFDPNLINIEYFEWFLKSDLFIKILKDKVKGGIKTEIKPKHLLLLEIELPDISTQIKISRTVQKQLTKIEHVRTLILEDRKNIHFLRNQIFQDAITGKLTIAWRKQNQDTEPAEVLYKKIQDDKEKLLKAKKIKKVEPYQEIKSDETSFDIPASWKWCRLGSLLNKLTDGTHLTPSYTTYGIPFISVKDVSSGVIDFTNTRFISTEEHKELYKRCDPEYGDILLTKVGTTGIAKVVDVKKEFSLFVSVALLKFNQVLLYNHYLEHLINSPFVKSQSESGTKGIGNQNLVLKTISNFIIPLPPISEQKEIVRLIDSFVKKTNRIQKLNIEGEDTVSILSEIVLKKAFINE